MSALSSRSTCCLLLSGLLTALAGGCAKVHNFRVAPRIGCPGDPVTVTWETNGRTTLSADPAVEGLGAVEKVGTKTVRPDRDTVIKLETSRLLLPSSDHAEADFKLAPGGTVEFAAVDALGEASFSCPEAERALRAILVVPETQLTSSSRALQVTNMNTRELVVSKGSSRATVAPQSMSEAFRAEPATGEWVLQLPLREGESCKAAREEVLGRLTLGFQLSCQR